MIDQVDCKLSDIDSQDILLGLIITINQEAQSAVSIICLPLTSINYDRHSLITVLVRSKTLLAAGGMISRVAGHKLQISSLIQAEHTAQHRRQAPG